MPFISCCMELGRDICSPGFRAWLKLSPFLGLDPCSLQLSALTSPCACELLGGPLGVGASSDSLMGWTTEDNFRRVVCRFFTNPRLSEPHVVSAYSSVAGSGLWANLTCLHPMDRLALKEDFQALELVATMVPTSPAYDLTWLTFIPICTLSRKVVKEAFECPSGQYHKALLSEKKVHLSDAGFLYSSWSARLCHQ